MYRWLAVGLWLCVVSPMAEASALHGFTVAAVPEGDALNVRSGPGVAYPIQDRYPNGTNISLTGRCTRDALDQLNRAQKSTRLKTQWCEIWHDPAGKGAFTTGWVHGRYIQPH